MSDPGEWSSGAGAGVPASQFVPPAYPPTVYAYPQAGYSPAEYPGPGHLPPGYAGPRNSGNAIAVMTLGITGIALTFLCPGTGLVTAIISLVMARGATEEIERSGGQLDGLGMIAAGRITSWITIGLTVLGVLVMVLYVLLFVAAVTVEP